MSDKTPLYQPPPQGYTGSGYNTVPNYNAAPPPAYSPGYPPPAQATQTHNNTVILTQPAPTVVYHNRYGSRDHFLLLSIILSFLCFLSGTFYPLFCTIPAIFMAINAQEAEARGDNIGMERNRRYALYLNIGALVTGIIGWVIFTIWLIVYFAAVVNTNNYGYIN